ncbi:MAG: P22 phage major capsid protein family protein [Thermus aquaticus]|uniref:P22 phage major capsid protein family protein n=1 Tax=Thermus aquaticus TaxID=271 RepID=UPI003C0E1321
MPINIIDGTGASAWIPQVWAQEILSHLRSAIVLAKLVNKDYSAQVASEGNQVNVPVPVNLTAQDIPYSAGEDPINLQTVPVRLDRWKGVQIRVTDLALAQSRPDILSHLTRAAAIALAEAIERDLFSLYTAAGSSVGTPGTNVTPEVVVEARQKLVENKVPASERKFLVLSPKDYAALLTAPNVAYALNYGGADAIRQGQVPTIYGLEVYESQLVPVVSGTPPTTYNLALARDALVLVTRPLPAPDANVRYAVVTDDESGLAFRMTLTYETRPAPAHVLNVDLLYGVAVLRPEFLVQVRA